MQEFAIGLRERNKQGTRLSIHNAAADLTLRIGLHETTVASIVDKAGVSQRTFFNYFQTKEHAILGIQDPVLLPSAVTEYLASTADPLTATVELLLSVFRSGRPTRSSKERRNELMKRYPSLRVPVLKQARDCEVLVEAVVARKVALSRNSGMTAVIDDVESEALALTSLAGAIIRYSYRKDLAGLYTGDNTEVYEAIHEFVSLAKSSV